MSSAEVQAHWRQITCKLSDVVQAEVSKCPDLTIKVKSLGYDDLSFKVLMSFCPGLYGNDRSPTILMLQRTLVTLSW